LNVNLLEWKGTAVGRNAENAKKFLEKRYNPNMELEDGIHTALLTLKDGFEGTMSGLNIEVGIADCKTGLFRYLSTAELYDYLKQIE
jgi:20S proteasome subunit alpha 2